MQRSLRNNKLTSVRHRRKTRHAFKYTSIILLNISITLLEEENKSLRTSLEYSQAEIEDLKVIIKSIKDVNLKQEAANNSSERIESELKELHRRHVKLECHSRRGNMKFFGIKERENETNSDTEQTLRDFMRMKIKIPL